MKQTLLQEAPIQGGAALIQAGQVRDTPKISDDNNHAYIRVKQLKEDAIFPTRATPDSAGLDLHAIYNITLDPGMTKMVNTGLSIAVPKGSYGRLAPRSGNTLKKDIDVKAGVVDADYRGEVGVVLYNRGKSQQKFKKGDKIAQLILEKCDMSSPLKWDFELDDTERGEAGFGSSDKIHALSGHEYENLTLSDNPYMDTLQIECRVRGNDSLLGLDLDAKSYTDKMILIQCKKGTSSARIPKWRSQLRGAVLQKIGEENVKNIAEVERIINDAKQKNKKSIRLTFATLGKVHMHPQRGVPQLFHDQLNILSTHQQELRRKETVVATHCQLDEWEATVRRLNNENHVEKRQTQVIPNKLTRKWLMQQSDWDDWQKSEWKQLDQYEQQKMFGQPEPRPSKANILTLLWTYLVKTNGVKKARCCCNGNPGRQGSITLSHTYAACVLEQPAQRIYWGIVALEELIAVGADASNAFAEAPPPKAPLYVLIDKPYRDWYRSKGRGEIQKGSVLRVKHAIQGHPEAPRLWSIFIDDIIRNRQIGLTPTTHEQCLYFGTFNNEKVYFLRQVDDFSVASKTKATCDKLILEISKHLTAPLKNLGVVDRFNGVQIEQNNRYIKIHNKEYVEKILEKHGWLNDQFKTKSRPIPMRTESAYLRELEMTKGPVEDKEKKQLEIRMKFSYRQALGEVLYAMVTCRPDISMAVTKLSQYANSPSEIHYNALILKS